MSVLYYIHDPMCSWCYAFGPTLGKLLTSLPAGVEVRRLLGGLAPDSEEPMPPEMRMKLQQTWSRIQHQVPDTKYNFDFWTKCEPRRRTWRACRAIIVARQQDSSFDELMTQAIQRGYYREARNPSDRETLIALAEEIGVDKVGFAEELDAPSTQSLLDEEMAQAKGLGVDRYPSLVLDLGNDSRWRVPVDYNDHLPMLELIESLV